MMGPVRRKAFAAAQQAYTAASDGRDLVADMRDGFGIELEVDWDVIVAQFQKAMLGQLKGVGRLPLKVIIDPKVDA